MHATGLASEPPGQLVHENVARFKNFYPDEVPIYQDSTE